MNEIQLVAAIGGPINACGFLQPVFEYNQRIFAAGETPTPFESSNDLTELKEESELLLFEPKTIEGEAFSFSKQIERDDTAITYGLPSYILYFSTPLIDSLGGEAKMDEMIKRCGGIKVIAKKQSDSDKFFFCLFDKENLITKFLPELISICERRVHELLPVRYKNNANSIVELVSGKNDELAQLAQAMMNLAPDAQSIAKAMQYFGLMILLSPKSENFEPWIEFNLKAWNFAGSAEYWKKLSLGLLNKLIVSIKDERIVEILSVPEARMDYHEFIQYIDRIIEGRVQNYVNSVVGSHDFQNASIPTWLLQGYLGSSQVKLNS